MAKWLEVLQWIASADMLPQKDTEVIGAYLDEDNEWAYKITWITTYDDVVVDEYGFPSLHGEVVKYWRPIIPPNATPRA